MIRSAFTIDSSTPTLNENLNEHPIEPTGLKIISLSFD
jgi:hypothetical protein